MKRLLLALILLGATGTALAQDYPSRPVRIVVPFPAGSTPDQVARITGQQLQEALGQAFVVDSKPGAQGAIAAGEVAKSPRDGYTLLLGTNTTQAQNPGLFKKLSYDPARDFTAVARISSTSLMLVVKPDFPARSLAEFLAHARAHPGELTSGYGSAAGRIATGMMEAMGNVKMLSVPYKGVPQAAMDVISGQISFTFVDFAIGLAQMKGGKLKVLAVTSAARTPLAPEIPALAEELPGFEFSPWYGLVAPAGTPRAVVNRLYEAARKEMAKPEVAARFTSLGLETSLLGPDEFDVFMKSELAKWTARIKQAGIPPE
jgi:tripartite-type tricarboxylate transporter receptor subunit TctC